MVQLIHNILPYLKYILFFILIVIFAIVNSKFLRDPLLRNFILSSLATNNDISQGGSGKAMSGFVFSGVIAFSSIMAVMHSEHYQLPDYMFNGLLLFVAALYSIKLAGNFAGKYTGNGNSDNSNTNSTDTKIIEQTNTNTQTVTQTTIPTTTPTTNQTQSVDNTGENFTPKP
jgi:hypothetical protein